MLKNHEKRSKSRSQTIPIAANCLLEDMRRDTPRRSAQSFFPQLSSTGLSRGCTSQRTTPFPLPLPNPMGQAWEEVSKLDFVGKIEGQRYVKKRLPKATFQRASESAISIRIRCSDAEISDSQTCVQGVAPFPMTPFTLPMTSGAVNGATLRPVFALHKIS
jgi:hypothetical protein